jgi:hypothetical protein
MIAAFSSHNNRYSTEKTDFILDHPPGRDFGRLLINYLANFRP